MPFAYVIREAYEPDNASRYDLLLTHDRGNLWSFAWLNAPRYGRACTLNRSACIHVSYLAEKLGYGNEADLVPILRWLAAQDFDIHNPTDS
jgi:hypothetical protein